MSFNHTLAIIKPDSTTRKIEGNIIQDILNYNFEIVEMKTIHLKKEQAENFYKEHKGKPFFENLINFMISNKIIVLNLKKENAVSEWREIIGSTNPEKRVKSTLRSKYAISFTENSLHGSDSEENARKELSFFNFNYF